jgi:hypothetical protein
VINQIKNLFRDNKPIVRFSCVHGAYNYSPTGQIKLAADLKSQPSWLKNQRTYEDSRDKFLNCPGMSDYMKTGYIIPAWENIKIKANTADTVVLMEQIVGSKIEISPMNYKLVDGLAPIESSVKLKVTKITTPWAIFTKSGYSAYVLPAIYYSPFLKDLYVYPGIVDYDKFTDCNFVFTAIRACEIEIPMGTPLLQIIPFKREDIGAVCMKATEVDRDKKNFQFPAQKIKAAYRKFCHSKKTYTLEHKE